VYYGTGTRWYVWVSMSTCDVVHETCLYHFIVMSCAFVAPRGVWCRGRARGATGVGFLACCFSRRHWAGEKAMVVLPFMIMCDLNLSMSHNLI
jgi:hypothetical protein